MSAHSDRSTIRIVIHGRVQGVWFRGWTVDQARALGLAGWVRNRRDGTVEALLIGPTAAVREMIEACRSGPPAARVRGIEEHPADEEASPDNAWHGFEQRPTV